MKHKRKSKEVLPGAGTTEKKNTLKSNSYGSTNCIRFKGIISARPGTPLHLLGAKIGYFGENRSK